MWLSLNIISKMVDINDITPEELANRLTMSTAEIDGIEYMNKHLRTVVTAKAVDVQPHPNADKLTLVDIDTGTEKFRVVCGAPNHKKGDIVALAKEGTSFNDGEFVIKKTKIRGEESIGMLCSAKELGLSEDHNGIMIFPEDTQLGVPLSDLYSNWSDVRLDIDNKSITHRPDLWSHQGFAREIGALLGKPVKDPVDFSLQDTFKNTEDLAVSVKDGEAAPRYSGLVIKNIKIEESPEWLQAAVTSIGMRPISNIVDITNYVMAELGQPMHAFDRQKLRGNEIIVRLAESGEILTTLDGQEHKLTTEDIVIADKEGPIALAGVMGGGNSEIEDGTTEIVLESANFNPVTIRKTAHRFNSRTDAAIRFEKSLSPETTTPALIRCYDLIKQVLPEAEAVSEIVDDYPKKPEDIRIEINMDDIKRKLGEDISDERIMEILTSLDYGVENNSGNLTIDVPHYRATKDIGIPADIVEEVGRIYGYDNIDSQPPFVPCKTPDKNKRRAFERAAKETLSHDFNMTEIFCYSFVGEDTLDKLKINEDKELRLSNPVSQEQDRLRRSLVPNLVNAIELNQRYNESFSIYELGRAYVKEDRSSPDLITENFRITGACYRKKAETPLFYEAKRIVTGLLEKTRVKSYRLLPETKNLPAYAHPGRSMALEVAGKKAGLIFELHPTAAAAFELAGTVAIFDLDLDLLYGAKKAGKEFTELPKYPEVPFEVSVLADKFVYTSDICTIIKKTNSKFIKSVDVLSIYEGEQIPEDKKSVSIKIIFASKEKTFDSKEIEEMQNKVINSLNKKGYTLR
ncbi:MAG: phenylalanine--tRNA ligase subunit beta [bacterium]|nr:phenylalanine--tRNA ligase subunit beta [bacterium]